jgi:hypothetical protein
VTQGILTPNNINPKSTLGQIDLQLCLKDSFILPFFNIIVLYILYKWTHYEDL